MSLMLLDSKLVNDTNHFHIFRDEVAKGGKCIEEQETRDRGVVFI